MSHSFSDLIYGLIWVSQTILEPVLSVFTSQTLSMVLFEYLKPYWDLFWMFLPLTLFFSLSICFEKEIYEFLLPFLVSLLSFLTFLSFNYVFLSFFMIFSLCSLCSHKNFQKFFLFFSRASQTSSCWSSRPFKTGLEKWSPQTIPTNPPTNRGLLSHQGVLSHAKPERALAAQGDRSTGHGLSSGFRKWGFHKKTFM